MTDTDDPYLWLEDVDGERALAWVAEQNARTLGELEGDPRYAGLHEAALAIVTARDRIPYPHFLGAGLANFWQDDDACPRVVAVDEPCLVRDRPSRIGRRSSMSTRWRPPTGATGCTRAARRCAPEDRLCLVALSDGGKDAARMARVRHRRESALSRAGSALPEGKQSATWLDDDTLLVARDWGPGTMTASGYPFILKRWRRGMPLDAAEEMFRGAPEDVSVRRQCLARPGRACARRRADAGASISTRASGYLLTDAGPVPLAVAGAVAAFRPLSPVSSSSRSKRIGRRHLPSGALVSLDLAACLARSRGAAAAC